MTTGLARRLRDIAVETLVATVLVTALVVYLFETDGHQSRDWAPLKLIANTGVVFWVLIRWFRYAWRWAAFWAAIAVLLVCHALILIPLVYRAPHLPGLFFVLIDVGEVFVFGRLLERVTPGAHRLHGR